MKKIEVINVGKSFKEVKALDEVSLEFEENKIYGLLGRNGAGKSTLLNIISDRICADSGEVMIDGECNVNNDKALLKIYLMSEKNFYPETMKVMDAFKWTKNIREEFDIIEAKRLSELFQLETNKKLKSLSTGYTSIFKVIMALSFDVPYVFMDEPVLGLDANHREMFYRVLIESYADNPRTFILSTHLIEEVSNLIEEVVIIKDGNIIKQESCEKLLQSGYTISGKSSDIDLYCQGKHVIGENVLGNLKVAYLIGQADKESLPEGIEISKLDLQKLFIQLTN